MSEPQVSDRVVLSQIEQHLDQPSAAGLALAVSRAISRGELGPGTLLPPVRDVAHQLALSPTTVAKSWRQLRQAGLVTTDGRRGTRVVAPAQAAPERYGLVVDPDSAAVLDLSTGVPDAELLPSLTAVLGRLPAAFVPRSYRDDPVLPALRKQLLGNWPYRAEQVAISDGAMDAVAAVVRTLVRFGDRVVVEDPTFPPFLDLLESIGADVVGVMMDDEGVEPTALERVLKSGPAARLILLQPRAQNPTGISMSSDRARRLATVIRLAGVMVVEDDSSAEVSISEAVSIGRWLPEQTLHVRGFSKSHGPDLRVAALSGPTAVLTQLAVRRQSGQGWTSRLLQQILLDLLTDPSSMASVARARETYHARRERLRVALAGHGVTCTGHDGLNLWVPVRDEAAARVSLAAQGVAVAPGSPFQVNPGPAAIRVTTALAAAGHRQLATDLARAAQTAPWSARQLSAPP